MAVARPADELRTMIAELMDGLRARVGVDGAGPVIVHDAMGPGYGRRWSDGDAAAALLAQSEAILADSIYTAKALAGLIDAVRSGNAGGTVVFWHGGGTPGLFEPLDP